MQFKFLAALLFGATALALPQATGTSSSSATDDETALLDSIPTSILAVMETAIPTSWLSDIMDPSSRSSIMSEIEAGTLPAWYNSLPSSVMAWATGTAGASFVDSLLGGAVVATATGMVTADANAATGTASVAIATSTATGSSGSGSAGSGSAGSSAGVSSVVSSASSAATSKAASASSAASSAHASATSTGGAPVATGGVALSMAGVASILGLALAL